MSWFKNNIPMNFCDCLRKEVSEALKTHAEYGILLKEWSDLYNKKSKPILCKDYYSTNSTLEQLRKQSSDKLDEYNYHLKQISQLIHYKDIVRVDVNGLTYDVGYIDGVLGYFISIREVKNDKTN